MASGAEVVVRAEEGRRREGEAVETVELVQAAFAQNGRDGRGEGGEGEEADEEAGEERRAKEGGMHGWSGRPP